MVRKKALFILLVLILINIPMTASRATSNSTVTLSTSVSVSWYKKQHMILPTNGAGTDYTIKIVAHSGNGIDDNENVYLNNHSRSDFSDVRFRDIAGGFLNYWIESYVPNNYAIFWVKIPGNLSASAQTVYMYYGNYTVPTKSNGDNTFLFFDDFSGSGHMRPNSTKWHMIELGDSYVEIAGGKLICYTGNDPDSLYEAFICTKTDWTAKQVACEAKTNFISSEGNFYEFGSGFKEGSATTNNVVQIEISKAIERARTRTEGSETNTNITIATGTYHIYSVLWSSTTIFQIDGSQVASHTTNIPNTNLPVFLGIWSNKESSSCQLLVDWVFVRKYVSSEPTHGSWGNEEKCPGDCNSDGYVNGNDLFITARSWHRSFVDPAYDPRADFNMDGSIDGFDLFIMAVNWHRGPLN